MENTFDIIVVGGGPAGLTAAIYASRAGASVLVLEKLAIGGQATLSFEIANYPGVETTDGFTLCLQMKKQAESFGAVVKMEEVKMVSKTGDIVCVKTSENEYCAKKLIICTGAKERMLEAVGEGEYIGKGVSYCASCDGSFFKGKDVVVVGGGNTAFEDAVYLSKLCKKVYLVHRRDEFRADKVLVERVKKLENVEFVLKDTVVEILGDELVNSVKLKSGKTLNVSGVFVAVGRVPDLDWLNIDLEKTGAGYIKVNLNCETSAKNIYAAGDITDRTLKQIITACAEGAIAANSACLEIKD